VFVVFFDGFEVDTMAVVGDYATLHHAIEGASTQLVNVNWGVFSDWFGWAFEAEDEAYTEATEYSVSEFSLLLAGCLYCVTPWLEVL
jgi:hypothetical protein